MSWTQNDDCRNCKKVAELSAEIERLRADNERLLAACKRLRQFRVRGCYCPRCRAIDAVITAIERAEGKDQT
jgi:hypothetical protein